MLVRLTRLATANVERTAAYYEGERPGLGEKFLQRVEQAIDRIEKLRKGIRP